MNDAEIARLTDRALSLYQAGQFREAETYYRKALSLNPCHAAAAFQLSRLLVASDKPRDALKYCLLALQHGTVDQGMFQHLIRLLYMQPGGHALAEARDAIVQCFHANGFDLQQLSRPVTEILKAQVQTGELISLARQGNVDQLQQRMLARTYSRLFDDELLVKALTWTLFCDPDLEVLLGGIRKSFLKIVIHKQDSFERKGIVDDGCHFLAALACQCFSNEYCYATGSEETDLLQDLETALTSTLAEGGWDAQRDPARILVYGMYRPLYRLPEGERLFEQNGLLNGEAFSAFLDIQWFGPREEDGIGGQIPAITAIDDITSRKVREMYEESPYPPWLTVTRRVQRPFVQQIKQMFPSILLPQLDDGTVEMLIAGCGTGKQAIMSASRFTHSRLLAVDLSRSSLSYAARKTRQLGIDNITFAQADILQLAALPQRFHVIEAVGVLHHMQDPQQGLAVLAGLLRPNGLMNIGLYSELARRHIAALQAHFRQSGLQASADDIRNARTEIVNTDSEACRRLRRLADFYSISGCRDLLFHVQERRYRLPEVAALLAKVGLRFLGFGWTVPRVPARYQRENPDDRSMSDLSKWDTFEQRHPDTFLGMYVFWCQKA